MKKHLTALILAVALVSTASATQRHQHEQKRNEGKRFEHYERRQGDVVNVPDSGGTLPLMAMGLGVLFIAGRNRGKTVNSI